jgi:hypothetical protein
MNYCRRAGWWWCVYRGGSGMRRSACLSWKTLICVACCTRTALDSSFRLCNKPSPV